MFCYQVPKVATDETMTKVQEAYDCLTTTSANLKIYSLALRGKIDSTVITGSLQLAHSAQDFNVC